MRFIIKCLSDSGFDFPTGTDFRIFFPDRCDLASTGASVVVVTMPWGQGTFKFGAYTVTADFEYHTIDFGYSEPLVHEVAERISATTRTEHRCWQVPLTRG